MSKHVMALTYQPKIEPVQTGACRQTIRGIGKHQINPGDQITFHGWTDRPYRSKWSWRLEVVVSEVILAEISEQGIFVDDIMHAWTSWYPDRLAEYDYINPPTGVELRDVLFDLNDVTDSDKPLKCQIIRW